MDETVAREHYIKLKVIHQHLEQLDGHMLEIDEKTNDLRNMIDAVSEAGNLDLDDEILVPLTNGIFLPAKVAKKDKLFLNVGANTNVTRTISETVETLEKQERELAAYREKIMLQQLELRSEADKIEAEVQSVIEKDV